MKMKTKKKAQPEMPVDPKRRLERIMDQLGMMKHRDLQIACVSRGMSFQDVVDSDHNKLGSFFIKNFDNPEDPGKLIEYDKWIESELEAKGYKKGEQLLSPCFKLGYVGKGDLEDLATHKPIDPGVKKVIEKIKTEKVIRVKDESTGVVAGTKKNLTYLLTREGKKVDEIIEQVKAKFPEAEEKSIKIWIKRCLKEMNDGD